MANLKQQVADLQEIIDQVDGVLQEAWEVTATREELAEAIGTALDIISPDNDSDAGDEDEEEDQA
jgi:hypothetical protein